MSRASVARGSAEVRMARRSRAGFTLVELMVAVTMLSIVMYMTMESLVRQQKTAMVTDQVVEVQNNVRAVAALVEREIRMSGFMVPNAVGVCGLDRTNGADELWLSETEPITPDDERAGDLGARLASTSTWLATYNASSQPPSMNLDASTTDLDDDGSFFYDNDNNGTNEADFRVGGGFILADASNPHRGSVCGTVRAVTANQITLNVIAGQLDAHVAASDAEEDIVIVPAAHYAVDAAAASGRFERNGDLLLNGVDDFQVSYFFDNNDDGVVDPAGGNPNEERGRSAAAADDYLAGDEDNSALREVRFAIVVRTRAADPDFDTGSFQNRENRDPVAGNDNFRRRVIEAAVRPRNIGVEGAI